MATEKAAETARRRHAHRLIKLGAHAVAVDKIRLAPGHAPTFGIVAFFTTKPATVGATVGVTINGKRVEVPVKVIVAPPFGPEGPP